MLFFPRSVFPSFLLSSDAENVRQQPRFPPAGEKGLTLVELLVAIGIIGVVGAMAIPNIDRSSINMSTAVQTLIGDVRIARASAIGRGVHFRVTLNTHSYSIQRLQGPDAEGLWSPDPAFSPQIVDLPPGLSLGVPGAADGIIEFNTRGLVEPLPDEEVPEIEEIVISKAGSSRSATLKVWPSGQILEV